MLDTAGFDEAELQKAAALYCEGLTAAEISDIMSVEESTVQRMIEHAEQANHFAYAPRLMLDGLLPEVNEFVHNEMLTATLRRVLNDSQELNLVSLHITRSPEAMFRLYSKTASESSAQHKKYREAEYVALRACAARAADELSRRLFDGADHTIGVNWGISVKLTIDRMRPLPSHLSDAKLSVISLFGDLDFHPQQPSPYRGPEQLNCNRHVQQLAQRLGGSAEAVQLSVPGFIPAEFTHDPEIFHKIRFFLGRHASYQQIFGELPGDNPTKPRKYNGIIDFESDARITKMDTIITGFGSGDGYSNNFHFLTFWLSPDEVKLMLKYCAQGKIVGDIAGHLLPSESGKDDNDVMNFLLNVNRRILAAQPSDFVDVASRHRKNNIGAGVVGVTVGARKSKIVARLLAESPCPISALFIDTHCALALLAELSPSEFKKFVRGSGSRLVKNARRWSKDTLALIPA